ncbi:MAG: AzlD domain-containing protein [Lachnospiraceae bacterium]|nr:AzlD domain-containing protein [Lachnospiraceae bacterium]
MTLSTTQALLTIGVVAVGTLLTRSLTFVLFSIGKTTPKFVKYLGEVLPFGMIGMLVIYCIRHVSLQFAPFGLPELIAGVFVAIVHKWKHNILLSIGGGTVLYMFLLQMVFYGTL